MAWFDRWRRPKTAPQYVDRPVTDPQPAQAVHEVKSTRSSSWMWLLFIPLLLLLGIGIYSFLGRPTLNMVPRTSGNFLSGLFSGEKSTTSTEGEHGLQFGVGGSPATPTPTPSASGPTPTSTTGGGSTSSTSHTTNTPTATPTPTSKSSGEVQSSSSERVIPSVAPETGRVAD